MPNASVETDMSTAVARPPGPPRRPFVGNLPEFGRDVLGFLGDCATRYGDVVSLQLGAWPTLLVNRTDLVEQVLSVRYRSFHKHTFFFRHVTAIFGNGLLTSEGDFWLRLPRGAYVPFGAGPRLCIGQSFALMEASLILATVARRLRFDLDPGRTVTPFPRSRSGRRVESRRG